MIWFWVFITYALIVYVINCFFSFVLLFGMERMPLIDTCIHIACVIVAAALWPLSMIYLYLCYRFNWSNIFLEFLAGKKPYNPEDDKTLW